MPITHERFGLFHFFNKYNYFHILKDKINITLSEEFFFFTLILL